MIEVLYESGSYLSYSGTNTVTVKLTGLARKIHVRPIRVVEALEWMERTGWISNINHGYREVTFDIKVPERWHHILMGGS